ncbi:MAG: type II toxin-antitoxin system VapC family toxin [Chloroflexota bacterium]
MSKRVVLDSSILIDHLRDVPAAVRFLEDAGSRGDELWSSVVTRVEVLAGMRREEEARTFALLGTIEWVGVDMEQADLAGELGRRFRASTPGIGAADLILAALTELLHGQLATRNVKHFPMLPGLRPPY